MPETAQTTVVKAVIKNLDVPANSVTCLFNPTEYSFSKSVTWEASRNRGANVPTLEFTGGEPFVVTLNLLFDTHESREDVRVKYTNKLAAMAMVTPSRVNSTTGQGSPPIVEFQWGRVWSFRAVVTSVTQKFTLFLEDGTPTRATVDLTLKQVDDPGVQPFQNPTSGGAAGHRSHLVRQGETLDLIANEEYGHPRHWRHIADVNRIDNPFRLTPGTILALPPLANA